MRRRDFVLGAASLAGATQVWAQTSANSPRLAIVDVTNASAARINEDHRYYRIFFGELRRLGRIEGKNLTVERYSKEELVSDAVALAAEVVRSNPDVIYIIAPQRVELQARNDNDPYRDNYLRSCGNGLRPEHGPAWRKHHRRQR